MEEQKLKQVSGKFLTIFEDIFGFENIVQLNDTLVGVSGKRQYSKELLDRLRIKDKKQYLCLIYVLIENSDLLNDEHTKKNLYIRVDFAFLYENNTYRFDYESVGNKNARPVNLLSTEEYYFDVKNLKFYHKDKEILPRKIIDTLFEQHIKPTKYFKGLYLRSKLFFWRKIYPFMIKAISNLFVALSYIMFGIKHSWDIDKRYFSEVYTDKSKFISTKPKNAPDAPKEISFFGYPVSKWSLASYGSLILLLYITIVFYGHCQLLVIASIIHNNFLGLLFIILTLIIYETGLPILLKFLVKKTSKYYSSAIFKQIKV